MVRRSAKQARGHEAERLAERFLLQQGLRTAHRNYRCPMGEIDLVMLEGSTLVFVEVRYRASSGFGSGAETVDSRKQHRLRRAAEHYLQSSCASLPACRFDVVAMSGNKPDIEWIQDAFQA